MERDRAIIWRLNGGFWLIGFGGFSEGCQFVFFVFFYSSMYTLKIFLEYLSSIPAFDRCVCVCSEFIDVTALGSLDNHMTVARGFDTWLYHGFDTFPPYCDLHIMLLSSVLRTCRWVNFTMPVRNMPGSYSTTESKTNICNI